MTHEIIGGEKPTTAQGLAKTSEKLADLESGNESYTIEEGVAAIRGLKNYPLDVIRETASGPQRVQPHIAKEAGLYMFTVRGVDGRSPFIEAVIMKPVKPSETKLRRTFDGKLSDRGWHGVLLGSNSTTDTEIAVLRDCACGAAQAWLNEVRTTEGEA